MGVVSLGAPATMPLTCGVPAASLDKPGHPCRVANTETRPADGPAGTVDRAVRWTRRSGQNWKIERGHGAYR